MDRGGGNYRSICGNGVPGGGGVGGVGGVGGGVGRFGGYTQRGSGSGKRGGRRWGCSRGGRQKKNNRG